MDKYGYEIASLVGCECRISDRIMMHELDALPSLKSTADELAIEARINQLSSGASLYEARSMSLKPVVRSKAKDGPVPEAPSTMRSKLSNARRNGSLPSLRRHDTNKLLFVYEAGYKQRLLNEMQARMQSPIREPGQNGAFIGERDPFTPNDPKNELRLGGTRPLVPSYESERLLSLMERGVWEVSEALAFIFLYTRFSRVQERSHGAMRTSRSRG